MEIEKERLSGNILMPKWIWLEHNARYLFAAKFTANKNVIDCACGSGVGTCLFAEKASSVNAFDVSEKALSEARKRCVKDNIILQMASGTELPIGDDICDTYVSLETIEHIPNDKDFLREVSRVLKNGGCFVCSTPNRAVTNPGKKITDNPANIFHVREYNEKEFSELLRGYFKKVEIFGQNPNSRMKTRTLNFFGKFMVLNLATRLHQLLKLITSLFRDKSFHDVQKMKDGVEYEYLTAVCTK